MSPDSDLPVTDAVVADQIVAQAAEQNDGHGPRHTHCENCGTKLEGPYCHACGQHDIDFHRSFSHVFLEVLEAFFHFEGKFFRNIVTLLFQPGRLSADFNAGKRTSQMPPFRLYVFVSFLFFLLIFLGNEDFSPVNINENQRSGLTVGGKRFAPDEFWGAAWRETAAQMKPEDWQDPVKVSQAIEKATSQVAAQKPVADSTESTGQNGKLVDEIRVAADEAKGEIAAAIDQATGRPGEAKSALERFLEEQAKRIMDPVHQHELAESFKHHLPHLLLLCLPVFALYTRVLFRKSGQVYLQHLVVALHYHTFIYLWVLFRNGWAGLTALPDLGLRGWVVIACNLWLFFYPLLMIRHLFRNSWPKTIIKTGLLAGAYTMTLCLGFMLTALALFIMI